MGCGSSSQTERKTEENSYVVTKNGASDDDVIVKQVDNTNNSNAKPSSDKNVKRAPESLSEESGLPFREKHMGTTTLRRGIDDHQRVWIIAVSPMNVATYSGLIVSMWCQSHSLLRSVRLTDSQLSHLKETQRVKLSSWSSFWKSLNTTLTRDDYPIFITSDGETLEIPLRQKESKEISNLTLTLESRSTTSEVIFELFIAPAVHIERFHADRVLEDDKKSNSKRDDVRHMESQISMQESQLTAAIETQQQIMKKTEPLRVVYVEHVKRLEQLEHQLNNTVRSILNNKLGCHALDGIYSQGGARGFQHIGWAQPYIPDPMSIDEKISLLTEVKFKEASDTVPGSTEWAAALLIPVRDPETAKLLEGLDNDTSEKMMACFGKLNSWGYDVFQIDKLTGGNSLFHTAHALMQYYDIPRSLGLDGTIMKKFWTHVQAGYHPNAYHNARHAADVMQITHFILSHGHMGKMLRLSKEDCFSAILAAGIHDYNHPGYNNNFHTRTSAYLATLYNDRSVLENHHVSCIFEMCRRDEFDIFSALSEEQKKDIRDIVVEMVLSTDMGNHARIFSVFRRRLAESQDWCTKREDTKIALIMAIKTADISNCGRPLEIYKQWAESISVEFYSQGDVELALRLPVSPFMDRRKHDTDFPKGQTSFINYIVLPLFECMAEFLPQLSFTIQHCNENRNYWATL